MKIPGLTRKFLPKIAAASAGVAAWSRYWDRRYGGIAEPDQLHRLRTKSGISFALSRFLPAGQKKKHPVLLFHGLSGNHFLMDPHPAPSLARILAGHGYDTWAIDLRWAGFSKEENGNKGVQFSRWDFDEYLEQEVPTALEHILRESGAPQLHWIGHSMGGMLLYCQLTKDASPVRSGVAVASALDFTGSPTDFASIEKARWFITRMNSLPVRSISHALIPAMGRFGNPLEAFSYWQENVDPGMARRIHASYFEHIPSALLVQLATILEPGGIKTREGAHYKEHLAEVKTPILAIAADRDRQCSAESARLTFEKLGSVKKDFIVFGKEHGQESPYGHMDLLVGKRADKEVFPKIISWLDQTDESAPSR